MKAAELNRILTATQAELARGGTWARGHGDKGGKDTVQKCKCGCAACKGAKVR
jgi:hypothetical protein